jgi:uncharacterized membrane protein YgaE (UPF0421/DUF939 family)
MCDAVIGFIGVVIGAIIGLIPYLINRKERYKFESYRNELERKLEEFKKDLETKYEVRIKTHQEAFSLLMDLDAVLLSGREEIHKVGIRLRDWWNKNCFYLDKDSRTKPFELSNNIRRLGSYIGHPDDYFKKVYHESQKLLGETIKSIQDGIKVERLDVLEKPERKREE